MSAPGMSRFKPGDTVKVARVNPPGHRRTPFYVRGKVGVIERYCGEHLNPEELGYGWTGEPKKALYRVRFAQSHVWPDYDGAPHDTVDVDIYEHWLTPAGAETPGVSAASKRSAA